MYYVYILECADRKPYTGCTNDLKERMQRHTNGHVPATKARRPIELSGYTLSEPNMERSSLKNILNQVPVGRLSKNILRNSTLGRR